MSADTVQEDQARRPHSLPWQVVTKDDDTWIESKFYTMATGLTNDDAEFIVRACNSHHGLLEACKAMLGYIEMSLAHRGAMSVEQIMAELARVREYTAVTEIAHHIGCSETTRRVNLKEIRDTIAKATGGQQ